MYQGMSYGFSLFFHIVTEEYIPHVEGLFAICMRWTAFLRVLYRVRLFHDDSRAQRVLNLLFRHGLSVLDGSLVAVGLLWCRAASSSDAVDQAVDLLVLLLQVLNGGRVRGNHLRALI